MLLESLMYHIWYIFKSSCSSPVSEILLTINVILMFTWSKSVKNFTIKKTQEPPHEGWMIYNDTKRTFTCSKSLNDQPGDRRHVDCK